MTTLHREDHDAARSFLGRLERDGAKALDRPPVFSDHGGGSGSGPFGGQGWGLRLPGAKFDYAAAAGDPARNSAVAICLAWLADNFPIPEMRVVRDEADGSQTVIVGHPLIKLLRNPNPFYGWHALAKGLVCSYRVDGNAYWMVATAADGTPAQLWWLDHARMRPRWRPGEYLSWWDYSPDGGRKIPLDPSRVIHFRDGVDANRDRLGVAALLSALREVCSDNEAGTYTASILRNLGIVGYMLTPANPGDTFGSKEERDEVAESFQERVTGENRGRPLVANLALKADRVGMTPEEMALDKILKVPESRICAATRVPAQVAGLAVGNDQKTYANYAEARKAGYEDGIIPLQNEAANVITQKLMPLFRGSEGLRFEFDYRRVQCLSESEDAKVARYGDAYQKHRIFTLNQALKKLNEPPVPGGDRYADGSTPEEGPSVPPAPAAPAAHDRAPADPPAGGDDGETKALMAEAATVLGRAKALLPPVAP